MSQSENLTAPTRSDWYRGLAQYEKPSVWRATWQIVNTMVPYLALWIVMVYLVRSGQPYWWTLALAPVEAGLLVRIFIFFHDCCHGSFLPSRRANQIVGHVCGALTFTPFDDWRHSHAAHHATAADLDRRGMGDVWTMTVSEYRAAPRHVRIAYRIYRNPLFLFTLVPLILFVIINRIPHRGSRARERASVMLLNFILLCLIALACFTIGWRAYLLVQVPVLFLAAATGVWLFYIQHQVEDITWVRREEWDPVVAALQGSSYYRLPAVLQWFTGNIGLHHVHHLRPRIPNYNLQRCLNSTPALQDVKPLTIWQSLRCATLSLWDEGGQRLVSFRAAKRVA